VFSYRFSIKAYNILNPSKIGLATVVVNVDRNINSPVFTGNYTTQINENIPLGTRIIQVQASDDDGVRL